MPRAILVFLYLILKLLYLLRQFTLEYPREIPKLELYTSLHAPPATKSSRSARHVFYTRIHVSFRKCRKILKAVFYIYSYDFNQSFYCRWQEIIKSN
jgi:hypothetical protein